MALAHFYHWTIDYIRTLTMYELDMARDFMITKQKQEQGQGGGNGSQRHP